MNTIQNKTPKIVGVFVISAVLVIGVYVFILSGPDEDKTNEQVSVSVVESQDTSESSSTVEQQEVTVPVEPATTPEVSPAQPQVTEPTNVYQNGTYTQTVSYSVPKGHTNSIAVSLTVENDVITSVNTNSKYEDRESSEYTDVFDARIEGTIVGQPLDDGFVGRVGGASLTSSAFNTALNQILLDAKS